MYIKNMNNTNTTQTGRNEMTTGKGIQLAHGFEIVDITPKRDVWLERKRKVSTGQGYWKWEVDSYRIFWKDLNDEQKNQLLTYC